MVNVSLYAIEAPVSGLVKIGSSENPHYRFKTIQAMSPEMLEMRIISPVDGRELEKSFHERFVHLRHHGEWFRQEQELTVALYAEEFKHYDKEVLRLMLEIALEYLGEECPWRK